ncbi:Histone H2B subacrosomal variant [Heterocephalus glaber]|uniref:Histone H2B subacrosomal variant n=1 Tax=Heterocephalus glaber TaxID=10181 RepID=G5B207_HETGA|nr:histone H2B subacrosomal variant [Heterocephalus glaber]EHB03321.1 Histone H2B subacrosomal variant [Heterocephalus glaber]
MVRSIIKQYGYSRRHLTPTYRKKSYLSTSFGHRNYSLYISRVLKEVAPQRHISSRTLDMMNALINNIFERIATEAHHLMCSRNRCTLAPEDIQRAVYLLLPGKLAKYAMAFGDEAVHRYVHS